MPEHMILDMSCPKKNNQDARARHPDKKGALELA
jgi:hypothetical protein